MTAGRRAARMAASALLATAASAVLVSAAAAGPVPVHALPAPVAEPILAPDDAAELANALADATAEQDVCYGWVVTVNDNWEGRYSGADVGSNGGVGITVDDLAYCSRWVEFVATITYTPESSEAEDDASFSVVSNFTDIDPGTLGDLGIDEGALLGDNDDLAIYNATAALPVLVADAGLAPPVTAEPATTAPPANDRLTGSPGSDFLRTYGPRLALAAVLLVAGAALLGYLLIVERRRPPASPPTPRTPPRPPKPPRPPSDR
jgi:hypothetical protein